jgi:starch synthase
MSKFLKIAFIASEIFPFYKTGGLAEVAGNLPRALKKLGHKVIVITPLYGQILDKEKYKIKLVFENIKIYLNSEDKVVVNYWKGYLAHNLPVYFVENAKYFSKRKSLYGSSHENARFLIFDVACLKLISLLKFEADIVHCHDWHTGLIPFYFKTDFRYSKTLRKAKTIFTIHNLAFQLGRNWWEVPKEKKDDGHKRIPHLNDPDIEYVNFAKRAVLSADAINTVSEQYREEIMTKKFGQDMNRILKNRKDRLFGIVNGIDNKVYNPDNDPELFKNYNIEKINRKRYNKEYLQKKLGLAVSSEIPLIGLTSRVTFQKGFELLIKIIDSLIKKGRQIIIMGDGDKGYISALRKYAKKYPRQVSWLPFTGNQKKETLIYASADIFLLPSHHEPCGINQLIAMRYGCVPVVRKVGGLYDTVKNYNSKTNYGTGFCFSNFDAFSLEEAIDRAIEVYNKKDIWRKLMFSAMKESYGWEIPAKKYEKLFKKTLKQA